MIEHPQSRTAAMVHVDLDVPSTWSTQIAPETLDVGIVMHHRGLVADFAFVDLRDDDRSRNLADLIGRHRPFASTTAEITGATPVDSALFPPSLTIAICTKDRPERLARLLESISELDDPAGTDPGDAFEVLVVDNAPSDDRTADVAHAARGVRYVREPMAGLDFARNRAIIESESQLIAFLDDDVVVDPGWLRGLHLAWRANPDAGGYTGLVMPFAVETAAQVAFERNGGFGRGARRQRLSARMHANPLFPVGAGSTGAGCNMAFDRQLVVDLGGFDDALDTGSPLPGGGDLDMFFRVIHSGRPIGYEPAYAAYHEHRRTAEELRHQYYTWGLGLMAYLDKTARATPGERRRVRALRRWWLRATLKELRSAGRAASTRTSRDVLAELKGGVIGASGEYRRSQRRTAQIRARATTRADS